MSRIEIRKRSDHSDHLILGVATAVFTAAIALLGAVMMTLTSSPLVKGASFLWLPAALQLIAGVWLGPLRGFVAGGVGAQIAGIIAYGGWAPSDFIMNLIAGGIANSMLPGLLFRWLHIDPAFGAKRESLWRAAIILLALTASILALAILQLLIGQRSGYTLGGWGYVLPLVVVLIVPLLWRSATQDMRDFVLGLIVSVIICFISAAIGTWGAVVSGQSWEAAVFATGIGWFLGDTVSCILGLYILAQFTERARRIGIAPSTY